MSQQSYHFNTKPLSAPEFTRMVLGPRKIGRKFAFGYYFGKRNGCSFRDLAEQYAPYLKEVYFPWPGLLSARELKATQFRSGKRWSTT